MGLLSTFAKLGFEAAIVTGALFAIIGYLPSSTVFVDFPLEPVAWKPHNYSLHLTKYTNVLGDHAERLLAGRVVGPESLAIKDDLLYTGLADGRLVEVDLQNGHIRDVTRFSPSSAKGCDDGVYYRVTKCGRPLGLRFDSRGYLNVIDAYFGLFRVNATTGHKKPLGLGPDDKNLKNSYRGLFNDFVLDPKDENIAYVTVSSTKWGLDRVPWSLNEHENSGLLLALELKTGKVTKVADGLFFANGVEVSADGLHLLVTECTNYRILKFDITEARKVVKSGKDGSILKKVFIDNLPGEPDNLRLHDGNIYVGFAITRVNGPVATDLLASVPIVRKVAGRVAYLTSVVLNFVRTSLWDHHLLEEVAFKLYSGHIFYHSMPSASAIGVFDGKSGVVKAILGSNQFNAISEAIVDEKTGDIFFGSFRNTFVGRVSKENLKGLF